MELVPGTTMAMGMSGTMSNESIITEEDSLDLDETLIEQYEKQADFWRENYYKPWRFELKFENEKSNFLIDILS